MPPTLSAYLNRIGYTGQVTPTADVLRDVHRAHLRAISYENLDIHLGLLMLEIDAIYDKIVNRRRGGWCYEMNSLLAWALREIGFEVRMVSGAVNRARAGDLAESNHLVLLVQLDQLYVADAGFGNGFLEPLPLAEGEYLQNGFHFRLERDVEHAGRWLFHNHASGGPGFDFTLAPRQIGDFAERCQWLQTSPDSGFVRVTVCHRFTVDGYLSLRGAVLQRVTLSGQHSRTIEHLSDYRSVLAQQFDLDLGNDVDRLWPKVWSSHLAWVQAQGIGGA